MAAFIFPDDPDTTRPFHFCDDHPSFHARIGGNPPTGIPIPPADSAEYFGTLPLSVGPEPRFFSLFITCPVSQLVGALNQGPQADTRVVAVIHSAAPRSTASRAASHLSPRAIQIGAVVPDQVTNDTGERQLRERHKFGGRPFCVQEPTLPGSDALFQRGYRHIVQIDFPISRYDGQITGAWPFGDGMFNFFWRAPFVGESYVWYIQG